MYEKFYNLTREPFHITPDPQFLYLSESHKQALGSMIYGIEKRKGFVAITGPVGTGKTTIVRTYLDKAAVADLKVIYIFQANISFNDLVRTVYRELGLELSTNDLVEMVNGLHVALIDLYRQGKTVVIIIDEAQNMPVETLENLRMLSNLETPTEKLIQIVLVGQNELEELLEKYELRQLKQRIAIRARIAPLNAKDSLAYIEHRLSVAGAGNGPIFDKKALDVILKEANGIPRKLNVLCDNALITGFGYQKNPITAKIAKEVILDFVSPGIHPRRWRRRALLLTALGLFFLLMAFFLLSFTDVKGRFGITSISLTGKPEPVRAQVNHTVQDKPQEKLQEKQESIPRVATVSFNVNPKPNYNVKVVRAGETLSILIKEVYGVDPKDDRSASLIELVKRHNPGITDSNLIVTGSVIRFPQLPKR
jgi:general secretion pathway protein A